MIERPTDTGSHEPQAPEALARDLARLVREPPPVPEELDRRILAAARARLGEIPAAAEPGPAPRPGFRGPRLLRHALPAAAALVLALGTWMWVELGRRAEAPLEETLGRLDPRDLDRSGRVDILDAMLLALRVEEARADRLSGEWDFNLDGRVDGGDVELVAARAVAIDA